MSEDLVVGVVGIVLFLTIGGVILLRPISKHLGEFLQVLIEEKRGGGPARGTRHLDPTLERMEQRIASVEDRLEFTEKLLDSPPPQVSGGSGAPDSAGVDV